MKFLTRFSRFLQINYICLKYRLDEVATSRSPIRFWLPFSSRLFSSQTSLPRGKRIRLALEELGPIFVKFGQQLSTREDILPKDIIQELVLLQDKVPPFCSKLAKKMIEQALSAPLSQYFDEFDETPIASASIAQIHAATLKGGREVVIKVLRPHIHAKIHQDIELLKSIAQLTHRYWKRARPFKPKEIVAEFEKTLYDELDLMREAANASQLRRNFSHSPKLYIPEIYWPLTQKNILVMERIEGIPIYHKEALIQNGFNLAQLATLSVELFFTQVFRDCFFHADMHPGNIFVAQKKTQHPQFIMVDFGIMGSLSSRDQRYLAENFLAFFKRDYQRVAELHLESGWIPSHVRVDEFEASIRRVCEPMFERPLKDISFGNLLLSLFQTASRFQINIQPQLILLQKTLVNVEGLARNLYPELDLWQTAQPMLEKWMKSQMGMKAFIRKVKSQSPYWLEKLPDIPQLLLMALSNAATGEPTFAPKPHSHRGTAKGSKKDLWFGMLIGLSLASLIAIAKGYF